MGLPKDLAVLVDGQNSDRAAKLAFFEACLEPLPVVVSRSPATARFATGHAIPVTLPEAEAASSGTASQSTVFADADEVGANVIGMVSLGTYEGRAAFHW